MSSEFKQLVKEAVDILGSNGNSEDLLLAIRLHNQFIKEMKRKVK